MYKKFEILNYEVEHEKGKNKMFRVHPSDRYEERYDGAGIIIRLNVNGKKLKQCKINTSSSMSIDKKIE